MPQVLTFETTLPPEEVTVGGSVFFTNERWRVQSQSPRVCTLIGRPPIPWFKLFLTIMGFIFCIVPGVVMYFLVLRDVMRLQNIVVNANPTPSGSSVMITFPGHKYVYLLVHRFLASLPPAMTQPALVLPSAQAGYIQPVEPLITPVQLAPSNAAYLPSPDIDLTALPGGDPYIASPARRVDLTANVGPRVQAFVRRCLEDKRAGLIFASVTLTLLLTITGLAGYYFWFSNAAIEQKLDAAITKGNLFKPDGESAYDFYHQLKKSGADAKALAPFEERLLPEVTTQPLKLISGFTVPTNPEPPPSEWQNALKPMQWACEMRPGDNALNARAKYIEGRIAFISNQKDQALDIWKKASDLDRTWALPPNGVGVIYNEKKGFETARKYLFEAIRREANWAVPYNSIGTSYFFEKKYDDAWSYYMKAIERSPNWARPHAWLGDVAMRRSDFVTAADEYQKALDLAQSGNTALDLNDIKKRVDQAKRKSQQAAENEIIN